MGGQKHQKTRVAAYTLILQDQKLLLCRLTAVEKSVGSWTLPGGGIDFGEAPKDAAVREVYEETGLKVVVTELVTVDSNLFHNRDYDMHSVSVIYRADIIGGALRYETDGSTDRCEWFTQAEIKRLPLVWLAKRGVHLAFG